MTWRMTWLLTWQWRGWQWWRVNWRGRWHDCWHGNDVEWLPHECWYGSKLVGQFALGPFAYRQPIKIQSIFVINQLSHLPKSRYKLAHMYIDKFWSNISSHTTSKLHHVKKYIYLRFKLKHIEQIVITLMWNICIHWTFSSIICNQNKNMLQHKYILVHNLQTK